MRSVLIQRLLFLAAIATVWWLPAAPASGSNPAPVLTQHNDNGRTGAYLGETSLQTANVNSAQFGKLFVREVDGQIYAQPLYVPGVAVTGGPRNVVYAATMHNSVYAFDADNPDASAPLWHANLGLAAPVTYTLRIPPPSVTISARLVFTILSVKLASSAPRSSMRLAKPCTWWRSTGSPIHPPARVNMPTGCTPWT